MNAAPLIGITSYVERARWGAWDMPAAFVPYSYVRAATIFGPAAEINSYHHQGIADPGRPAVTGWAGDGVVEAVEDPDRPYVLGVQHPEEAGDVRPFATLVELASEHPGERVGPDGRPG